MNTKDKYIHKLEELNAMMMPHAEFYGAESDSFMNLLSQVNRLKAEIEQPEPDINTPFFGNTGAEIPMNEVDPVFKAKRFDNGRWIEGLFCKYQFHEGGLFIPCIQVIKERDEGDYLEYYEIIPDTLQYASQFTTQRQEITDEEIEKEAHEFCITSGNRSLSPLVETGIVIGMKLMRDKQGKGIDLREDQSKPTDEDIAIEILARFHGNSRGLPIAKKNFIDGAKWARERK